METLIQQDAAACMPAVAKLLIKRHSENPKQTPKTPILNLVPGPRELQSLVSINSYVKSSIWVSLINMPSSSSLILNTKLLRKAAMKSGQKQQRLHEEGQGLQEITSK